MKLKKEFHKLNSSNRLYQTPVPLIGLTGGIATGKSTVSEILKSEGIPVLCADELVKKIYKLEKTLNYLRSQHPEVITNDQIQFEKLREKFFNETKTKEEIEKLIYSQLPEVFKETFENLRTPAFVIYDVPLLFEKD